MLSLFVSNAPSLLRWLQQFDPVELHRGSNSLMPQIATHPQED